MFLLYFPRLWNRDGDGDALTIKPCFNGITLVGGVYTVDSLIKNQWREPKTKG